MAVARPRRERPTAAAEAARVAAIFELLTDFLDRRLPRALLETVQLEHHLRVLELADRIAARTEED